MVGSPGSRCPGAEPLFLRVYFSLSVPEELLFEKMVGSNWDLHYYSLANHQQIFTESQSIDRIAAGAMNYTQQENGQQYEAVFEKDRSGSPTSHGRNSNKGTVMEG